MPTLPDDRLSLLDILTRRSLSFGEIELASGERSDVYVDGKLTTCNPEAMPLIGRMFLQEMKRQDWFPEAVGGLTVGADPIAFAIARESVEARRVDGSPLIRAFIVRKAAKEHGKHRFIEGLDHADGCNVVIIDDVCTKGGSTGQAIDKAKAAGMIVLGAICLVDRQQGATELLASTYNTKLASIFKLRELLDHFTSTQVKHRVAS